MTNGTLAPTDKPITPAKVDVRKEYVAGGGWGFSTNRMRQLSWAIDEDAERLGDDFYERMSYDPQVLACTNVLKAAVLEDGARLTSAVDDEDADGYELAKEIADVLGRNLEDLQIPFDDVIWNLMDAMAFGNKVAEQVYHLDSSYTGKRQLVLRALKVKPRRSTAFVVDVYWNLLGLVAHVPGRISSLSITPENILPRDKFAIVTFRPKDSDPRGTSIYRAAVQPFSAKIDTWPEYLKYLAQFATPSIWGTTPEFAGNYTDPVTNETFTAIEMLLAAMLKLQNGTAAAFAHGNVLNMLASTGEGEAFLNAFKLYDQQITKAILHQTLATEEGEHQARSASEVHQDILGTIVRQIKQGTERAIAHDIVRPWVRYNYGDAALALLPKVTLGDVDHVDFVATAGAIASLSTNYLDPSQYTGVDQMLGLPARVVSEQPIVVSEPPSTEPEEDL